MDARINPRKIVGPYTVCVSLTNRCNVKCPGCLRFNDRGPELSVNQLDQMFRIFTGYDVKRVALAGGEPLLRKDLHQIIERAGKRGLQTALCTNGLLLNEKTIKTLDGQLTEIIIPYHSTEPSIATELAPYADAAHLGRMEKLFHFISGHTSIQLKPETIMSKINSKVEQLVTTGERLHECGARVWKLDEYYHVDKPDQLAEKFCIPHHEYPVIRDLTAKALGTMMKVVGIGGSIRYQTTGFVVSPVGHAYINIPGPAEKKILGDIIKEHERMFRDYNGEVLIPSDYKVLAKEDLAGVSGACVDYYPINDYQDQASRWAYNMKQLTDIGPREKMILINPGFSAEFIGECVSMGTQVFAYEPEHAALLERLTLRYIDEMGIRNSSLLGNYTISREEFRPQQSASVDTVVFTQSEANPPFGQTIARFLRALYAVKPGGKIVFIAPISTFNEYQNVFFRTLNILGITDNGTVSGSVWRPFLPSTGLFHVFKFNDLSKVAELRNFDLDGLAEKMAKKMMA